VGPQTIADAFPPPAGSSRVQADAFGAWIRDRPLAPASHLITAYDGSVIRHDGRVVDMPLVPGDLQQCADSVIRLRAEWLRQQDQPVLFHATSGDPMPWARYRDGETPYADGNALFWRPGGTGKWEDYLVKVFTWAGTDSLQRLDSVSATEPMPGAILVEGGFPGHAVLILDVARSDTATWLLVGEGFMPAQDFHVERGPDRGWWPWTGALDLGHWDFDAADLRAFKPADG
jgi:hypothetical protein